MISDIEMPSRKWSWTALLGEKWKLRYQNYFLTNYADFNYAQKQLNCKVLNTT